MALLAAATLLAASCGGNGKKLLPNVSGKAGEVIVVIDQAEWESEVGDELRTLLASDCPFLPQKEPLYTLVNINPTDFSNIFQIHRNLLLVDINPALDSSRVEFRSDVWASPQCVINIRAKDSAAALGLLKEEGRDIQTMLEQAERDRIITNSKKYEDIPPACSVQVRRRFPVLSGRLQAQEADRGFHLDSVRYANPPGCVRLQVPGHRERRFQPGEPDSKAERVPEEQCSRNVREYVHDHEQHHDAVCRVPEVQRP